MIFLHNSFVKFGGTKIWEMQHEGAQWLSGRVLDLRAKGRGSGVTSLWSLSKTHLS